MGSKKEPGENPKAKVKWSVVVSPSNGAMEAVTAVVSSTSIYIICPRPLRLNEIFEMDIELPQVDRPIRVKGEVILSNIYGPDDEITPRGMCAQFVKISSKDRKAISTAIMNHLGLEQIETDLNTIDVNPDPSQR